MSVFSKALFASAIRPGIWSRRGTVIYGLEPAARSRLNAILISAVFVGMSIGSAFGSAAFAHAGWRGVNLFAATCGLAALGTRFLAAREG